MPKANMNDLLKNRMAATRQASELAASDEAYQKIFQENPSPAPPSIRDLPLELLTPFFTADIGFRPYSEDKLKAFVAQLQEEGLLVRIIVRAIGRTGRYEILAGHNRVGAAKLAGWTTIPAEIVDANDTRAIVIATSTNLIQRQVLSIAERGKAYKALLDAKNRHGQWYINDTEETFGDNRQKFSEDVEKRQRYNARKLVAEFFDVSEYEIRKAVKLTQLIPSLLEVLETSPKLLNLTVADMIAEYDEESQKAFGELCCIHKHQIRKPAMQYIVKQCPPPSADCVAIITAFEDFRAAEMNRKTAVPKQITFERKKFAPYLDRLGSEAELENLFLDFLRERLA